MDGDLLKEVLDELDDAENRSHPERRKYERIRYRCLNVALIIREVGHDVAFMVVTRNLSRGGVSLLHRHAMSPGQPCTVVFPMRDGPKQVFVTGRTARCRHVRGLLHEVGIRFDKPITESHLKRILERGRDLLKPATTGAADPARASSFTALSCDRPTP